MPPNLNHHRRHFLTVGILALGGVTLNPVIANDKPTVPNWVALLEEKLLSYCTAIKRKVGTSGALEFHCAMTDPLAFGMSHGNLAGLGLRARAQGSRLTLQKDGYSVNMFIHSVPADL